MISTRSEREREVDERGWLAGWPVDSRPRFNTHFWDAQTDTQTETAGVERGSQMCHKLKLLLLPKYSLSAKHVFQREDQWWQLIRRYSRDFANFLDYSTTRILFGWRIFYFILQFLVIFEFLMKCLKNFLPSGGW